MCGRFTITKDKGEVLSFLNKHFNIDKIEGINVPRFNIGPGQDLIALIYDGENYRAGLIPWDYKVKINGQFKQVINARSETVQEKYSFKNAFRDNRCIILTDGFYEWDQQSKQPYRFILKSNDLYFYAGIYDQFKLDDKKVFGTLILTTEANDLVLKHHQRMPVIFNVEKAKAFLRKDIDLESLQTLLEPLSETEMISYPVDKQVNKMTNDFEDLIKKTTNN